MKKPQPLNSYKLISAAIEQQSEEGTDSEQLGRRLAVAVFASICYFKGKVMVTEKENNNSGIAESDGAGGGLGVLHSIPL